MKISKCPPCHQAVVKTQLKYLFATFLSLQANVHSACQQTQQQKQSEPLYFFLWSTYTTDLHDLKILKPHFKWYYLWVLIKCQRYRGWDCFNFFWPHGLQDARHPRLSPSNGVCSNSCPLNWWCHPAISSCHPLLLPPSIFPCIRVFSNESVLYIRWPKYWSFSFSISLSNEYLELISFRIDWFDLAVQGTPQGLLQHHSSKASILMVQFSHPYMTIGKTIALPVWIFIGKEMSLLF